MRFPGLTDFGRSKAEHKQRELAYRIAYYMEDYDPYGFRDAMETGQSLEDGIEEAADYVLKEMLSGNYSQLIQDICDPDLDDPELRREMESIIEGLRKLESLDAKQISKNHLKLKRRKNRCN